MPGWLPRLLLGVLLGGLLAGAAAAQPEPAGGRLERILQRQRLIVGIKADYPPFGMVAPDGSLVGLEADLARELADRLGVGLELVAVTAGNRLQRLDQGTVDMVIATLGDTAERRQLADLVLPHYYASGVTLLAREGQPFHDWGQLHGRTVCLTDGAYYNRTLAERYLIDPVILSGTRDTLLALRDGRCVGWAFDDTVLAPLVSRPEWAGFHLAMPDILPTPWAIALPRGEGDGALGRIVADAVADWHRSGRLIALQAKWGLPASDFLQAQQALWSACGRDAAGRFPPACIGDDPARVAGGGAIPGWAAGWPALHGLNLAPLVDGFDRARLLRGLALTLGLSALSIAGALAIGVLLAWAERAGPPGLRWAVRGLVAVARMTPPILQLYILAFGLGGLLARTAGVTPSVFLTAAGVFSCYAGATNAVLLSAALAQLQRERPGGATLRLLPAAIERSYEALVSTAVNVVKAVGLASTIAVPEVVSVANSIIAEGGNAASMMNLLLLFYFLFVLAVLAVLRAGRALVLRWA